MVRILWPLTRLLVVMVLTMGVLAASVVLVAPRVGSIVGAHVSDRARVSLDALSERSYIYDRYGNLMATLVADQNRVQVRLDQISLDLRRTVLAIEDANFYEHKGVNVKSIGRALSSNLESGGVEQGGSTITQQVVKNSIVGNKQDLSRKLREAVLAVELEKQMTKSQILERYLNTVYFGNGAYGVEAAAELYFGTDAGKLTVVQSALLTALIRSPVRYDPIKQPSLAKERRALVLDVLVRQRKLSGPEAALLKFVPLPTSLNKPRPPDDYFVEEVKQQLLNDPRLGATPTARYNAVFGGGLRVYTTFDPLLQRQALAARDATLPENRGDGTFALPPDANGKPRFGTAAMASVDPTTGAVRMLVGGPGYTRTGDYDFASYDIATQGLLQPGSSFKVFVLTAAMEQGYSPEDLVSGRGPCRIPGYSVPAKNFGNSGGSVTTIRSQTLKSVNCAYLRLGQIVGLDNVVALAKRMGITTPLEPISSLPIGSKEVHPLDMAAAYSVLANDGVRNPAYFIDRVTDSGGRTIFEHRAAPVRVVSSQTARLVTNVLIDNVRSGTGTRARLDSGQEAAGKTGTTNDSKAVWFVGYTPQVATAVWMGGAQGAVPLSFGGGATGGRYPALTWGVLMNGWLAGRPLVAFPQPEYRQGGTCLAMPTESSCYGGSRRRRSGSTSSGTGGGRGGATPPTATGPAAPTQPATKPTRPGA